ncbi:pirin domain-containing protein [Calothrix sp. NIES-4101]|nr:pirin domain-containing protein [Calothrix sp. NIES-4101]
MLANTTQNIIHKYWKRGNSKMRCMESQHTFSFGGFFDAEQMGFRCLQVINDNYLYPGHEFSCQNHCNTEIITYVVQGQLEHKNSWGKKSLIEAGEVGISTATTSMSYQVLNPCRFKSTHFLNIWINANHPVQPKYQQEYLPLEENSGKLLLLAASDNSNALMTINQDVQMYSCYLQAGDYIKYNLKPHRYAWLYMVRGVAVFDRKLLVMGDSVQIHDSQLLMITTEFSAEFLLFDMA